MKKVVLTGLIAIAWIFTNAQVYKKGDVIEFSKQPAGIQWTKGRIVEVNAKDSVYLVLDGKRKNHTIPFKKEDSCLRRPVEALTASMATNTQGSSATDILKQKVTEDFESEFSDYDSVTVVFNEVIAQEVYKNNDPDFGMPGSDIYPFNVDVTVRLVSINKDGVPRKLNWQIKRKYLLFTGRTGYTRITLGDKDENFLSHI